MKKKDEEMLRREILTLRNEVKQLRDAVNLLLEMMIEHEDGEAYDVNFINQNLDKNDQFKMGM
jgi:hypothetical protein